MAQHVSTVISLLVAAARFGGVLVGALQQLEPAGDPHLAKQVSWQSANTGGPCLNLGNKEVTLLQHFAFVQVKSRLPVHEDASSTSIGTAVEEVDCDTSHPHLVPKVMVPFNTKPGETPRKVQIQR